MCRRFDPAPVHCFFLAPLPLRPTAGRLHSNQEPGPLPWVRTCSVLPRGQSIFYGPVAPLGYRIVGRAGRRRRGGGTAGRRAECRAGPADAAGREKSQAGRQNPDVRRHPLQLTHDCDAAGIIAAFGSAGSFLHSPLAALGPRELVDLLHAEGLATKVEPGGKVFPQSDRALDVLDALVRRLRRCGAELALDEPVTAIHREGEAFCVVTPRRTLSRGKVDRHQRRQELSRLRHDG